VILGSSGVSGVVTRSYGCTCYDWPYDQDITQCATTGTLPRRAAGVIRRCEALGTTKPHPNRVAGSPVRESRRLPASRRSGARVDGRANSGELPINVVNTNKPKALTGLNQKVSGQGPGFPLPRPSLSSHRRTGRASTIRDTSVERGKPVILPRGRPAARWTDGTAGRG
jgi:hypothetical protein